MVCSACLRHFGRAQQQKHPAEQTMLAGVDVGCPFSASGTGSASWKAPQLLYALALCGAPHHPHHSSDGQSSRSEAAWVPVALPITSSVGRRLAHMSASRTHACTHTHNTSNTCLRDSRTVLQYHPLTRPMPLTPAPPPLKLHPSGTDDMHLTRSMRRQTHEPPLPSPGHGLKRPPRPKTVTPLRPHQPAHAPRQGPPNAAPYPY